MPRVLIIDDDVNLLNVLSTHLRHLGHAVYTAASGTEGIATFKRVSPHGPTSMLEAAGRSEVGCQQLRKGQVVVQDVDF